MVVIARNGECTNVRIGLPIVTVLSNEKACLEATGN